MGHYDDIQENISDAEKAYKEHGTICDWLSILPMTDVKIAEWQVLWAQRVLNIAQKKLNKLKRI